MGLASELQEAVGSIPEFVEEEFTCEEMGLFLNENPIVMVLADELGGFAEAIDFMDEAADIIGDFPTPEQIVRLYEKVHSPFKNKSSLTLDAHIFAPPNPRSNVKDWDCESAGKYKQNCTNKDGGTITIDMSDYYKSGKKAKYMKNWRKKTAGKK